MKRSVVCGVGEPTYTTREICGTWCELPCWCPCSLVTVVTARSWPRCLVAGCSVCAVCLGLVAQRQQSGAGSFDTDAAPRQAASSAPKSTLAWPCGAIAARSTVRPHREVARHCSLAAVYRWRWPPAPLGAFFEQQRICVVALGKALAVLRFFARSGRLDGRPPPLLHAAGVEPSWTR
jgi:hypothetical protein